MPEHSPGQELARSLPFQAVVPFMTRLRYAELTGASLGIVDA